MPFGAVADEVLRSEAGEIHAHRDPVLDRGLGGGHDPLAPVEVMQFRIAQAHMALAQAQLGQARSGSHQNRKGAG
jgi:hypothetical protein